MKIDQSEPHEHLNLPGLDSDNNYIIVRLYSVGKILNQYLAFQVKLKVTYVAATLNILPLSRHHKKESMVQETSGFVRQIWFRPEIFL